MCKIEIMDFSGLLCNENVDCKYWTWVDNTYNGIHGIGIRKRCHLKNKNANGISDVVGLISGAKGCRNGNILCNHLLLSITLHCSALLMKSNGKPA